MVIYTVKRGDSLYNIARRFGKDVGALARDNGLARPEALSVGETLVISEPKSVYTVKEGDTLYAIAQRFGVSVGDLFRSNPSLGGKHEIRAGDVLTVVPEPPQSEREIAVNTYVYPSVDRDVLRRTLPYLTYLTVLGGGVEGDGTLIEPQGDEEIVELARAYGVAPILQVAGTDENGRISGALAERVLTDERSASTLMAEIENALSQKRYRGVQMDFQGLSDIAAEAYPTWIASLRERVAPMGRSAFVSVTPRGEDAARDWYGGTQQPAPLLEASDAAELSAYGWGYAYGDPMAISPMPQVGQAIEGIVGEGEPSRVMLGMSQYGYDWTLPFAPETDRARSLDYSEATATAREHRAAIGYDETVEAPFARWFDREGGRTREHVMWFEDARSIAARLSLVEKYGLGGISVWNGMRYFPQLWQILTATYPIRKIWE